ncbi:hypothetical protein [Metabacillus halosaccharovorans]|uniref:hypothetical protein n=1 Tax=Metabacillus halosaccharovorans TaxID=930124 RepID=UPI001116C311|nr:hypothetical protein [Metabacillus halosaccharovorans]
MKIEKKVTYYGYDLLINSVLYKRCIHCNEWYEFKHELGYCPDCIFSYEAHLSKSKELETKFL